MAESFVTVGKAGDITPGEIRTIDVAGKTISVANEGGRFYAFDDECTHEACSLAEDGEIEGSELTCLCHFTVFDLNSGEVTDGPAAAPLGVYPARVEGDDLQVTI